MRRCWIAGLILLWLVCGASLAAADEPLPGEPDEMWNRVFARFDGWTGGDGAYSFDLGDGRTLWLFSDSWIGGVAEGKHAPGSRMVNNAIAVHQTPEAGSVPDFDALKFHWGPKDQNGHPTAWMTPDAARVEPSHIQTADGDAATWYWLADGIVAPGPDGKPRLLVFLWHVGRTAEDKGVWSFKSVGGALAVIDNPHEPISSWNVTQFDNPHTINSDQAKADPQLSEVSWGSEVMLVPKSDGAHSRENANELFIYGVKETSGWNKQLVLARAPAERCEDFATWRFRTAEGWSPRPTDAVPLADGVANEFSIEPLPIDGPTQYVMIHSEPIFGTRIMTRAAKDPVGPWTKPVPVFDVPDVKRHESYFTYAAKGHASLARPGELLVTYVINSHDFWKMAADASIYRPRFVRVPANTP